MPARGKDKILVAQIGAPHGIRGEVKLWSFTADPMAVKDYGSLEGEDGQAIEIEALRPGKGFLIARLKRISDRNAAERLTNLKLYMLRARLPAAEEGEFYHADLIGLAVTSVAGAACGTVTAVHNFGGGDLLEVKPADGPTVLLPFTDAVVPVVDLAGGRVVIDPPEGVFKPSPPVGESGEASEAKPSRVRGRTAHTAQEDHLLTRPSAGLRRRRATLSHKSPRPGARKHGPGGRGKRG